MGLLDWLFGKREKPAVEGVVLAEPEPELPPERRDPQLEVRLLEAPDDREAYAVYGDFLSGHGDPRGELIALDLAKDEGRGRDEDRAQLLRRFPRRLGGELQQLELEWRYGFVRRARVFGTYGELTKDPSVAERIRAMLAHPSFRFLEELAIGLDNDPDFQPAIDALAGVGCPSLRTLRVGDYVFPDECEISWAQIGDLSKLFPVLPRLARLEVQGAEMVLAPAGTPLRAEKLRHLEVRTGGLPVEVLRSIVSAELAGLETLILWFGDEGYGATATLDDLRGLLEKEWPALRHLGLMNCSFADALVPVVSASPLLRRLEVLDLSMGNLGPRGVSALLEAKGALGHLRRLDLSNNTFEDAAGLSTLCREVVLEPQRADYDGDQDRYVMVGE